MKNTIIKSIFAILFSMTALTSHACWYKYWQFNDYIVGINNYENHTMSEVQQDDTIKYTIKNNQKVDLPLSIAIKLDHNMKNGSDIDTSMFCVLQYRVLPNGEWQTVAERTFAPNAIAPDTEPTFYLGRNNINPVGLKDGDVIMVRLYISRGMTESGDMENKCDKNLVNGKLNDNYQYIFNDKDNSSTLYDLGGNWLPHLVATVVFSGNYRPVR